MAIVNELRGRLHQGHALAGIVYVHLRRLRESSLMAKETIRSRMAKADASEAKKGRQGFTKRQRRREELTALGKRMLAVEASLPQGEFGPWLRDQPIPCDLALKAMRLARAVA
ncbi:hypothetical protein NKI56_34585 [Mesorhizobium sp. M0622]|uniref:hypothetical protein n=1 Tax=unclassified Mesorhizobium TaxID=325217 RepID=UPI0033374DD9